MGGPMRAWFDLTQDPRGRISFDLEEARAAVQGAAAAVAEIAASSPRPLLLGFSQGAGIALGVALLRPSWWPACSHCGVARALEDPTTPRRTSCALPRLRGPRAAGSLIPIELGRKLRDDLTKLGIDVEWHEYDMGHMVIPRKSRTLESG